MLTPISCRNVFYSFQIPFCKLCRSNATCETDLRLELTSDITQYLVGKEEPIELTIDVSNGPDGAYNSHLRFEYPRGMRWLQENTTADFDDYTCLRVSREDADPQFEYIECNIGNPILASTNRRMSFLMDRDGSSDLPLTLRFTASVQTKSTETPEDLGNNNKTILLRTVYDAELLANGCEILEFSFHI